MKKRLLFISSRTLPSIGGVERIVDSLASSLNERYEIRVITNVYRSQRSGLSGIGFFLLDIIKNFFNHTKAIIGIGYKHNGYTVVETYFIFWGMSRIRDILSFVFVPFTVLHYVYQLIIFHPDIVNLHFADNATFYAYVTKIIFPSIKLIVSFHGSDITKFANVSTFQRKLVQLVINKSDKIVFVSDRFKDYTLLKFNIPEHKIAVIHNGVDIRKYKKDNEIERQNNIILYVGRLVNAKGVDLLVNAFKKLSVIYKDVELLVGGDGPEKEKYVGLSQGYNIKFLGSLDTKQAIHFYSKSTFIVIPSRNESFGIVAAEAMACECPVIASEIGGLPEIISNMKNGLLFKSENEDELLKCMKILLKNNRLRKSLAVEALKTVKTSFSLNEFTKKYEEVFEGE